MWYVYVLYSCIGKRSYVGHSNDLERQLFEHNVSEKFLKTGKGRLELQKFVENYVSGSS